MSGSDDLALESALSVAPADVLGAIPRVGRLERLPKWMNLIPMVVQWLWLSMWYRSWSLPAAANPGITAGGLVGERKSEYFQLMGPVARAHTADFAIVKNRAAKTTFEDALQAMAAAELAFPLILKPEIGWCGFGVRIVRNVEELRSYLGAYPKEEEIILQRYVPYEGEAGIYYVRQPGEARGRITGLLLRFFPRVVGNGHSTIAELIAQGARTQRLGRDGRSEACCDTARIPASGEIVRLSVTGSTRVGGTYEDGTPLITAHLQDAIEAIANDMEGLHVARFDVRYESIGAMRAGQGFTIIEVNGAGSEAVHAWDPRYTLREAYHIVFAKQRLLFSIGAAMRERGHRPLGGLELAKLFLRQERLIKAYPPSN